jgi:hypothetical protein
MKTKWGLILLAAASVAIPGLAQAQSLTAPRVEVTLIPAGALVFTENADASAPDFGNYHLGGAVAGNVNRFIGVEGEIGTSIGVSQELGFGYDDDIRTPDLLTYSGNLVVSVPTRAALVPYVTGGVGGLTVFDREEIGINQTETLFTSNVGGGLKWQRGLWGLRADYRFIAVPSRDEVTTFGFGDQARYGHRVYGAVVLNIAR